LRYNKTSKFLEKAYGSEVSGGKEYVVTGGLYGSGTGWVKKSKLLVKAFNSKPFPWGIFKRLL